MSTYATLGEIRIPVCLPAEGAERFGLVDPAEAPASALRAGVPGDPGSAVRETWVRVWVQGVPAHIDYAGPGWDEWLPPPTPAEVCRALP